MSRISYSELTGNQAISGARRGAPDESYLVLRAPPSRPEAPAGAAPVGRGEGAVVSTCMHTRGPSWRSTQHTAMLAMVVPCRSATSLSSPRSSWKRAQLPHLMREAISMPSETQSGRSSWKSAQLPHLMREAISMQSETQSGRSSWKSAQLPHLMREAISMQSETQSGRSSWKRAQLPHRSRFALQTCASLCHQYAISQQSVSNQSAISMQSVCLTGRGSPCTCASRRSTAAGAAPQAQGSGPRASLPRQCRSRRASDDAPLQMRACHQRSSVVISGHQWSSGVIRGHHLANASMPSEVISGHQWSSLVISGHQGSSPCKCEHAILRPQVDERVLDLDEWQSVALSGNQWHSVAISGSQWHSKALKGTPWRAVASPGPGSP
jgi:hypothetical protein